MHHRALGFQQEALAVVHADEVRSLLGQERPS